MAGRALFFIDEFRQFFLDCHRVGLAIAALEVIHYALEGMLSHHCAPAFVDVGEWHFFLPRAVQHDLLRFLWQLLERHIDIEVVMLGQ